MTFQKNILFRKILLQPILLLIQISLLFLLVSNLNPSNVEASNTCASLFRSSSSRPLVTQITTFFDENLGRILHQKSAEQKTANIVASSLSQSRGAFPQTRGAFLSPSDRDRRSFTRDARVREFSFALELAASKAGLHISKAKNTDKSEIQDFILQARSEFGISSDGANSTAVLDADLNDIAASYNRRQGEFLVLRQNGKIVGTAALFQLDSQTAELRKIYISRSLRGAGLGQALMEHLTQRASELDYSTLELETYSVMQKAIALYVRNGFQRFYPERIASEKGVEAYRRYLKSPRSILEESEQQRSYRLEFENPLQNPFFKSIYENPERNGRFKYEVFEPFVKKEMRENSAVYQIYLELGVVYQGGRFVFPPVHLMMKNYIQALKRRNISESFWILPSLTYRRETAPGIFEYKTIIPYLEPFPSEPGFRLIEKVPDAVFEYAFRKGALPLSNFHDIHHFVALLHSRMLMIKLKTAFNGLGDQPFTLGQRRRFTYALESLSLVGRDQRARVSDVLKTLLSSTETVSSVQKKLKQMPLFEMMRLAQTIRDRLDSMLSHFSGIGMSATETALELQDYKNTITAKDLILSLEVPEKFDPYIEQNLPRNSFQEDPMYLTTKLSLLLNALQQNQKIPGLEKALRQLVKNAAIFMMLSSQQIHIEKWLDDMLASDFSTENETMNFIRNAFGENSITYRMLAVP